MKPTFAVTAACFALTLTGLAVPSPATAAAAAPRAKVVRVCVHKHSGKLRFAKSKKACHKGERFLKLRRARANVMKAHVVNVNVICNVSAEASAGGNGASASGRSRKTQTIRIPTSDGGTLSLEVTCGNSASV